MKLKINKWEFNVTNNDYILDNGACYQAITLKHYAGSRLGLSDYQNTIMSKSLFNKLVKENKLVFDTKLSEKYGNNCKVYKFNVED